MGSTVRAQDVSAWYGKKLAVRDVNLEMRAEQGHGTHRPVWMRKVDLPALHQPHARGRSPAPASAVISGSATEYLQPRHRSSAGARHDRDGLPAANPFPTMSVFDNVAAGPRLSGRTSSRKELDASWSAACDRRHSGTR